MPSFQMFECISASPHRRSMEISDGPERKHQQAFNHHGLTRGPPSQPAPAVPSKPSLSCTVAPSSGPESQQEPPHEDNPQALPTKQSWIKTRVAAKLPSNRNRRNTLGSGALKKLEQRQTPSSMRNREEEDEKGETDQLQSRQKRRSSSFSSLSKVVRE